MLERNLMLNEPTKSGGSDNEPPSTASPRPTGPTREVKVTHLDLPPSLGKERIHPRRPAPVVPEHKQSDNEDSKDDGQSENSRD